MFEVNYVAILVAAVASMVFGALWYSIFTKTWVKLMGLTDAQLKEMKKKGVAKSYFLYFLSLIVMAYVLKHVLIFADAETVIVDGLLASVWMWLGFIATVTLGGVLWEGKSFKLYLFNNVHNLLSLLVMGAILTVWV